MGAMRAAECAPYGFTALGAIARWYAAGTIDGDDEVAVLTHPETGAAITEALVNARYVAWRARKLDLLSALECCVYVQRVRDIFYMDRSRADLIEAAPPRSRADIATILDTGADLKRFDARFALRALFRWLDRNTVASSLHRTANSAPRPSARRAEQPLPTVLPASAPKASGTYDRTVSFARTLELLPELRRRYGITRVGETTRLDRANVPTFCAIVPNSPDLLGVYNGKGATREAATASAVMEAAERQIGAAVALPVTRKPLREVRSRLDIAACGAREDAIDGDADCVIGTDLLTGESLFVPLALVQCPWFGERLCDLTTSNGLASGNTLTEAVYHALCELIERHTWSMYHIRCSVAPRLFGGAGAAELCLAPEFRLPTGDSAIDSLLSQITQGGLAVRALLLDEPPLPYTVLASICELDGAAPMAHMGLGCALSPAHALTRALTEAVQSRVVDIQGAREDILRPGETAGIMGDHARRLTTLPSGRWYFDMPGPQIGLGDVPDLASPDLAVDCRRVVDALRRMNVSVVGVVDLSPRDLPVNVVRAIVPELETFLVTGHLGPHGRAALNPFEIVQSYGAP